MTHKTDWENAPEGATHWHDAISTWYKIADDSVFYSNYRDVWVLSAYEISDINLSQGFIARPTSTAIPEPKKLTQAVFDGLPPEYQWAAVDGYNGAACAYILEPSVMDGDDQFSVAGGDYLFVGDDYDATDWQNSKIEREPSVAEIVEAFAANPPNFDDLINSVANAQTLAEAQAEIERLKAGHDRYEIVRKLNVVQFQKLYTAALKGGVSFDQVVDLYGEFFDEN